MEEDVLRVIEEEQLTPPSPLRVARRAVVLSVLSCRSILNSYAGDAGAEKSIRQALEWFKGLAPSVGRSPNLPPPRLSPSRTLAGRIPKFRAVHWRSNHADG